ncbi:hypothetical protein RSOL_366860, partial [Rhizoctonia solani AG-3 Rhs1AP]
MGARDATQPKSDFAQKDHPRHPPPPPGLEPEPELELDYRGNFVFSSAVVPDDAADAEKGAGASAIRHKCRFGWRGILRPDNGNKA